MMRIEESGSVRVDLLGGTLDLYPIGVFIPGSCTLNFATSLTARVALRKIDGDLIVESLDYNTKKTFKSSEFTDLLIYGGHFGPLSLVAHILRHFSVDRGVHLTLDSDSPPGAGLGGSSTMGVVLYKALCGLCKKEFDKTTAVLTVKDMEACILQSPAGYQDYYPALYGGILGLHPVFGKVRVEQLYSKDLADFIQENFTLVFSGASRLSGVNNWEVYKSFFNGDKKIRKGLTEIASLSHKALLAIKKRKYKDLQPLVITEGECRKNLFSGIITEEINAFSKSLQKEVPTAGVKVCGAGGGGHFLVVHNDQDGPKIEKIISEANMKKVSFSIGTPL
ncbi:MAG: hypothetical protein OXB84_01495 [Halobacteriovoraceae bacterium]|nr:hypothetical protein [Halobacteriovoraceae bacterium]